MATLRPPDALLRVVARADTAAREVAAKHRPRLAAILKRAQRDLEARLKLLPQDTQTAQQQRSILIQQRAVAARFASELEPELVKLGTAGGQLGRDTLVAQAAAWDPTHPGTFRSIVRVREATELVDDALLHHYATSVQRYGTESISKMQGLLAESALRGESLSEATNRLATAMDLDKGWAERIARTETSRAVHRRELLDLREILPADEHNEWRKQLIAVVPSDGRTGADSFSVHQQIRKLDEDFNDSLGNDYPHPPNRPNDREQMVLIPFDPTDAAHTRKPKKPRKKRKPKKAHEVVKPAREVVKPAPEVASEPPTLPAPDAVAMGKVAPSPVSLEGMNDAQRAEAYAGASKRFDSLVARRQKQYDATKEQALVDLLSGKVKGSLDAVNKSMGPRPDFKSVLGELLDGPGGGRPDAKAWEPLIKRTTKGSRTKSAQLAREAREVMSELYSQRAWDALELGKARAVSCKSKAARAYYRPSSSQMVVDAGREVAERKLTITHELGHWLDEVSKSAGVDQPSTLHALARRWRDNRTKGDPLRRLQDIYPGHGYKRSEAAREDQFWEAYVGKVYSGQGANLGKQKASEVFTMGVQEFTTSVQIERLIKADPEHAGFVLHVLLGMVK